MARRKYGNGFGLILTINFLNKEEGDNFYDMITTCPTVLAKTVTLDEPTQAFIDNLEIETGLTVDAIERSSDQAIDIELRGLCNNLRVLPQLAEKLSGVEKADYRELGGE